MMAKSGTASPGRAGTAPSAKSTVSVATTSALPADIHQADGTLVIAGDPWLEPFRGALQER